MRSGSSTKVLAKRMLKYYRVVQCLSLPAVEWQPLMWVVCWSAGDLDTGGDAADDADEMAMADEEADERASRRSAVPAGTASFADAFAEILAHPGPAGGQAAPILAVRLSAPCAYRFMQYNAGPAPHSASWHEHCAPLRKICCQLGGGL